MSRGRKQNTMVYSSDWDQIFQKRRGYYFQYIISKLGKNQNKLLSKDNASDILIQIKKEKDELIKDKKIKQGKLQEAEFQSELFQIPSNWIWCKLDDLCTIITDGTHQTPSYKENGRPFISAQHVKPFIFSPEEHKYVSEEAYQECIKSGKPEKDDILVTRVGAIGEATVIDVDMEFAYYVSVGLLKPFKEYVLPRFLAYVINSPYGNLYSKGNVSSKGSSAGNFNLGRIRSFLIPLAPKSEQKKILNFLEDLGRNSLSNYETYFDKEIENEIISIHKAQLLNNQTNSELTHQLDLIKQLRQAFLREALQGKLLTYVRSSEVEMQATGHELLAKIKAEKAQLIAEKKLKKEKELPPITTDEIPFEIPGHWAWSKIGEIAQHNSGKTLDGGRNSGKKRDYITTSNLYWGYFKLDRFKQILIEDHELEKCTATKGDLLICEGGEAGRSAIWIEEYDICFQNHIHRVRPFANISNKFIFYFFNYLNYSQEINLYRKGMGISNLSSKSLSSIKIPLPPFNEQEQIVAKLEELMAFCDRLEQSIKESQGYNEMLLQQVLREALQAN